MENKFVENIKADIQYLSQANTIEDQIKKRLQANLEIYLHDISNTYQSLATEKSSKRLINKLIK